MRRQEIVLSIIIFMAFNCVENANASVLGTLEYSSTGSVLGASPEMTLSIFYLQPVEESEYDKSVTLNWNVSESDDGGIFWASDQTCFHDFVNLLTNAVDDLIVPFDSGSMFVGRSSNYNLVCEIPQSAKYESEYIQKVHNGVDFKGCKIDDISVTINYINFHASNLVNIPGDDTILPETWSFSYGVTYAIYGELIPEPMTIALLGLGAMVVRKSRVATHKTQEGRKINGCEGAV